MTVLWTAAELAAATGGRFVGEPASVTGASIDTRTLAPGDLFLAIRGGARDGHDFVPAALERGAALALVAEDRVAGSTGPLLAVPDHGDDPVLGAARGLGEAARARTGARIVAVTGSVGKTGTKEALRHVLEAQGPTHASVASYNNHWGVPLTLARMPAASAYGVFEVGMNHAGEIAPLTRMIRPHVAMVTTVEPVHIEFFRSLSGIADAKGEVFLGIEPGGVAILPRDNPAYARLLAHAGASPAGRVVSFGEHAEADVRAERIVLRPDLTIVDARVVGERLTYQLGTPGRHVALNSLAVLAAVHALGADLAAAGLALASLKPPVGRGERTRIAVGGGEALLIDESYNANPASVRAALANLAAATVGPRGRRIAVLGDMRELGAEGPALHAGLAEPVEASSADLVFTVGPLMRGLWDALPVARRGAQAAASEALVDPLLAAVRPGDTVMVKGSNSLRLGLLVEALKAAGRPAAARA